MLRNNRSAVTGLLLVALLISLLVPFRVLADFSLRDWQYVKAVALPSELQKEDLVEIIPDREVFAGSADGLADLRVITGEGGEVPYKLEISRAERQQNSFPVSLRDKAYVTGSYTIFTADLGRQGILHNEIEIKTPSTNFGRTATVETSNDRSTWTKMAEEMVYDFTDTGRRFTTRDTKITYPDTTARYVRVKIADEGGGPLEVAGATVFYIKETLAREVTWPASIIDISGDTRRRATLVELDLGTAGIPGYLVAIDVPEVNYYREVTVEVSTDREEWNIILSNSYIYNYDTPKFVGSKNTITYPENTSRYLRLVIHDEDSPPLSIQSVEVRSLWRRLVFSVEPQRSYQLYYGNTDARRPAYDIERFFPYLITEDLPVAKLGAQMTNPDFVEKKPPLSERLPWLFPVVIAIAAIIVAIILFGIIRQVRKVLPPPS